MTTTPSSTPLAAAVALLDRAAEQCSARGDSASGFLDDLTTWYLDALHVSLAADTLRGASPTELPEPTDLTPDSGADPLELVLAARDQLDLVPDEVDNLPLFMGRLRTDEALAAVRTHYE